MVKVVLKKCAEGHYSLHDSCGACGAPTRSVHPAKYSKEDKYAKYRRMERFGA